MTKYYGIDIKDVLFTWKMPKGIVKHLVLPMGEIRGDWYKTVRIIIDE